MPLTDTTDTRRLFGVLVLLNALWAPVNFVVKVATSHGMTPAAVAFIRWGSLSVLLFTLLATPWYRRTTGSVWPSRADALQSFVLGVLFLGPAHLLYYLGIQGTTTVEGAVFNTTAPLWTAVMAFVLLRERPTQRRLLAIVLGLIGAWIVGIGLRLPSLDSGHTAGNLIYMTAVVLETIVSVLAARLVRRASGLTVLAYQVLGAATIQGFAPILLPGVFPMEFQRAGWQAWASVAFLVLVPSLLCWGTWYRLVERVPLSLMVVTLMVQPPIAALIGWVFLRERYGFELALGSAIILAALTVGASEKPEAVGERATSSSST
jgi:drug/metabolite transporter (DMT)-like permease